MARESCEPEMTLHFTPDWLIADLVKSRLSSTNDLAESNSSIHFIDTYGDGIPGCYDFLLNMILNSILSPNSSLRAEEDETWIRLMADLGKECVKSPELSTRWKLLSKFAAERSLARARSGHRALLNARLRTSNVPLSYEERAYLADRDEGRERSKRGRRAEGIGKYLFARLWLEIIDQEAADVAVFRIHKHFGVSERHVLDMIARVRASPVGLMMGCYIRECAQDPVKRAKVQRVLGDEFGELISGGFR